jgi:hypothetical protein
MCGSEPRCETLLPDGSIRAWALAAAVAAAFGCGDGSAPVRVNQQVVRGRVLLVGGRPLTRGRLVLSPTDVSALPLHGAPGPDGTFVLRVGEMGVGAAPGEYRVHVEPVEGPPGAQVQPRNPGFPARYLDPSTSGLTVTITPETRELPTFVLK